MRRHLLISSLLVTVSAGLSLFPFQVITHTSKQLTWTAGKRGGLEPTAACLPLLVNVGQEHNETVCSSEDHLCGIICMIFFWINKAFFANKGIYLPILLKYGYLNAAPFSTNLYLHTSHVLCLTLLSSRGNHKLLFNLNLMTNFYPDFHPVFVSVKVMVTIQLKVPVPYQDF